MDFKEITPSEYKVITQLLKGLTNKEIANKIDISEKGVKYHLTNIYSKTETKTAREFIAKYYLSDQLKKSEPTRVITP